MFALLINPEKSSRIAPNCLKTLTVQVLTLPADRNMAEEAEIFNIVHFQYYQNQENIL